MDPDRMSQASESKGNPIEGRVWHVYIQICRNGVYYVGSTSDLPRRVAQHNQPVSEGLSYPRKHGPWLVVWSEQHPTRSSAIAREKQIKAMKSARWIREKLLAQRGC